MQHAKRQVGQGQQYHLLLILHSPPGVLCNSAKAWMVLLVTRGTGTCCPHHAGWCMLCYTVL